MNSSTEPLVSVVVPTHNRPHYLRGALESVLEQSLRDFEVIVVDDASDGDTRAVVEGIRDDRVRYHRNTTNLGMLQTNLAGFHMARGKYVANLHDDDRWSPYLLERLVPSLEDDETLSAAFADHYIIDAMGEVDERASEEFSRHWGRDRLTPGVHRPFHDIALVRQSVPLAISGVMRASAMDWSDFPPQAGSCYDIWLSYLASRDGWGAYYVPDRLAYYRLHQLNEIAVHRIRFSESGAFVRERFLADPRLRAYAPQFRRQYAESCSTLGIGLLRSGSTAAGRRALLRGLQKRPTVRGLVGLLVGTLPRPISQSLATALRSR